MEKNIKNYLHLYLGCDIMHDDGTTATMISVDLDTAGCEHHATGMYGEHYKDRIGKPILRPLSDMTDDEARKVAMIALNRDNDNGLRISRTPEKDYVSIWYAQWLPMSDYEKEQWTECDLEKYVDDAIEFAFQELQRLSKENEKIGEIAKVIREAVVTHKTIAILDTINKIINR